MSFHIYLKCLHIPKSSTSFQLTKSLAMSLSCLSWHFAIVLASAPVSVSWQEAPHHVAPPVPRKVDVMQHVAVSCKEAPRQVAPPCPRQLLILTHAKFLKMIAKFIPATFSSSFLQNLCISAHQPRLPFSVHFSCYSSFKSIESFLTIEPRQSSKCIDDFPVEGSLEGS